MAKKSFHVFSPRSPPPPPLLLSQDRTSGNLTTMKSALSQAREELRAVDKHLEGAALVHNHAVRTAREAQAMAKFSVDEATRVAESSQGVMGQREVRGWS